MRATALLLALLTSAAGCTAYGPSNGVAGLRLLVEPAHQSAATAVRVTLVNDGDRALAVAMTFGYHIFLDLSARQEGREIPFPVEAEFFDAIPQTHDCLRPDEARSVVLDLDRLRFLHRGRVSDEPPFRFEFDRTKPIEVQATYRNGLYKARCALPDSPVESSWLLIPAPE